MPRNRVGCSSVKFFPVLGATPFRPSPAFNGLAEFQSLFLLKGAAAFIKNNFTAHNGRQNIDFTDLVGIHTLYVIADDGEISQLPLFDRALDTFHVILPSAIDCIRTNGFLNRDAFVRPAHLSENQAIPQNSRLNTHSPVWICDGSIGTTGQIGCGI